MDNVIEVRIKKTVNMPTRITIVRSGVGNTSVKWISSNWRDYLVNKALVSKPRIWE